MFGLSQQVGGGEAGSVVASAITTTSLGPAIESISTWPKTYRLGQRDKQIAGADDVVDGGNTLDAIGQCGHSLGTANAIHFSMPNSWQVANTSWIVSTKRRGRGDHGQLLDASGLSRHGGHQHR